MSKWFMRSRKVWAVITVIAGMVGLPKELMDAIPVVEEAGPKVQELVTLLTPTILALWSAFRPDHAALTTTPKATNTPLGG